MKQLIFLISCATSFVLVYAQPDSLVSDTPTTSFENSLKKSFPQICYSYNDSTQTHDYSDNWDFDSDGKTDKVYFVGNGAAHLYFNLKIVLSSDGLVRNFNYLLLDFPLIEDLEKLKKESFYPLPIFPQFVVYDFDSDGSDEIFLNIDKMTFLVVFDELKRNNVNSRYILMDYKDGNLELQNFVN